MGRAGNQTRRRKDSGCWLEEVWRGNALVDPSDDNQFEGCVDSGVLEGDYTDMKLNCKRKISLEGFGKASYVLGKVTGKCDDSSPHKVSIEGGTIIMEPDSSDGKRIVGYYDKEA